MKLHITDEQVHAAVRAAEHMNLMLSYANARRILEAAFALCPTDTCDIEQQAAEADWNDRHGL